MYEYKYMYVNMYMSMCAYNEYSGIRNRNCFLSTFINIRNGNCVLSTFINFDTVTDLRLFFTIHLEKRNFDIFWFTIHLQICRFNILQLIFLVKIQIIEKININIITIQLVNFCHYYSC